MPIIAAPHPPGTVSETITLNTTLYDFIDVASGEFAAEDRLLSAVVTHLMETGQLRLTGDRRRLRRLLRDC